MKRTAPTREEIDRDYWPCACLKRYKAGNMSHIKLNHKSIAKCRTCGATREDAEYFAEKNKSKP
jgi:hypothetical protein